MASINNTTPSEYDEELAAMDSWNPMAEHFYHPNNTYHCPGVRPRSKRPDLEYIRVWGTAEPPALIRYRLREAGPPAHVVMAAPAVYFGFPHLRAAATFLSDLPHEYKYELCAKAPLGRTLR